MQLINMRSPVRIIASTVLLLFLIITIIFRPSYASLVTNKESPKAPRHKPVTHLVLLEFKPHLKPSTIRDTTARLMDLKEKCVHPIMEAPYILNMHGGKNNSPQDLDVGATHAFILEFASVEHRDYYIDQDPVHKEFKTTLLDLLENPQIVVDFTDGKFL